MSNVFIVKNQEGYFASKQKEWECGREPKALFRSPHRDEAINLVFELSSKDIYLRAEAISVELDDKKQPIVEVTAPPKPQADSEEDTVLETAETAETADSDTSETSNNPPTLSLVE